MRLKKILVLVFCLVWIANVAMSQSISISSVSGSPFCPATSTSTNINFTVTGSFTAGNVFTAQLSNASGSFASPTNIGTLTGTTSGTIVGTIPSGLTAGTGYLIRIVSTTPVVTSTSSSALIVTTIPGTPGTAGNGAWNIYGYDGYNFTTYYGMYTENSLSFNTTTRWGQTLSPSSANSATGSAYSGCTLPTNLHSYKCIRTNIPCGIYQIDVPRHDDHLTLKVDGSTIMTSGCCPVLTDIWHGFISTSTVIEYDMKENDGNSALNISISTATGSAAVPVIGTPTSGTGTSFVANWQSFRGATGYYLDVATDNAFTSMVSGYNNLDVGNQLNYTITGLNPLTTYYYRVRAYNTTCGISTGNSNTQNYPTTSLPVILKYFYAIKEEDGTVGIHWTTAKEEGSHYFTIERSNDALIFTEIASVKAKGNSNSYNQYHYIDAKPISDPIFYRLKQVDLDDNYTYSSIISVSDENSKDILFEVSSNPSYSNDINLQFINADGEKLVELTDIFGKICYKNIFTKDQTASMVTLNLEQAVNPGIYFLSAYGNGKYYRVKLKII